jgi:DNA-binding transcriptional ArsR family regulator
VHAFDVLGDPVRRRILELLASGERTSGALTETVQAEFGISQPAVSQHLRVLRENGFASVRPSGARRLYRLDSTGLVEVDRWLDQFRASQPALSRTADPGEVAAAAFKQLLTQRLEALGTELARGRRGARQEEAARQEGATAGVDSGEREHTNRAPDRRHDEQRETA